MKNKEIYNIWKERKSNITVQPDFTDRLMSQINKIEQKKWKHFFTVDKFNRISSYPLAKVGLIATSVIIGLFRITLVLHMFLGSITIGD